MAGGTQILSLIGLAVAFVAGYIGYAHPSVSGTDLPAAVGSWLGSILPAEWKTVTGVSHVKDVVGGPSQFLELFRDLQVPCGYVVATARYLDNPGALHSADVNPLDTILDMSIATGTISRDVVMNDRYLKLIYERYGKSKEIPSGLLYLRMGSLEATLPSPRLLVVDEDRHSKYQMRLGRDFMKANQAKVDLDEREVHVSIGENTNVMIPLLQTRSSPDFGAGEL